MFTILIEVAVPSTVPSSTVVECEPDVMWVDNVTECAAIVTGSPTYPPTGDVQFSTSATTGEFVEGSLCVLYYGVCVVSYTDSVAGNDTIIAAYDGDSNNDPSSGSGFVELNSSPLFPATVAVHCDDARIDVDNFTTCTATVSGTDPTGTIAWSSASQDYAFDPTTCVLSDGSCEAEYWDYSPGHHEIVAAYSGDAQNLGGEGSTEIDVVNGTFQSSTTVSCAPATVASGATSTCTAEVSGQSPTGVVQFATSGGGFFSPTTCELAGGDSCATVFHANAAQTTTAKVTATYSGDANNAPSHGRTSLKVKVNVTPTSLSIACGSDPVFVGVSTECTATVTGTDSAKTVVGSVFWGTALPTGSFSANSCKLSAGSCEIRFTAADPGPSIIVASYQGNSHSGASTGTLTLQAVAHLTLSPASGSAGSSVKVKGEGFAPASRVTLTFDGTVVSTDPAKCKTGASGSFSCTISVPSDPSGSYTLMARDASGDTASATFTIS